MKIAICGSMKFSKEMIDAKDKLERLWHQVILPANVEKYVSNTMSVENKQEKINEDLIRVYFEKIKLQDAILVLNITKNNIDNYVWWNSFIEMAFAHVLYKKIFLLNPIPNMIYSEEIEALMPIVLDGDLSRIG